jgi:hypothetical protein
MSRVQNVESWAKRLLRFTPISSIAIETARFDTQLMDSPNISGVEYQQGELAGYEVREYLLEKWGRNCVYCGNRSVPLQVEHIIPKSRGGSDQISNLTISCIECNRKKGSQTATEFGYPDIGKKVKRSMRDVATINSTRYATGNALKAFGLPVTFWSGGRTKHNRIKQGYEKDHWIDAACVGKSGRQVYIPSNLRPLAIKAVGHGRRQMCTMDKYGFPRTRPKQSKQVKGFRTGDIVKAVVTKGKKVGTHIGRVVIRTSGYFKIGLVDGINWKYCTLIQRADGYEYGVLR